MTKKFWNDWQNRIGETKAIYGWYENSKGKEVGGSLIGYLPFKIISVKFNGNTVNLVLETKSEVFGKNGYHIHTENKYFTFNRKDIATVEFI